MINHGDWDLDTFKMGDLGFEPRASGLRVRCATTAPVTRYFACSISERFIY